MFTTNPEWLPKYLPEGSFPDGVLNCFKEADGQWLNLYAGYLAQQTSGEFECVQAHQERPAAHL
ncbi:hypothetical protein SSP24_79060 [Streptomyces spinoverrucosus]|uniref:Uncharacterized protein n=1 Tax=Streptomyces spinoverrucosus TaxID=284043 RepID=A0A4Y3VWV3_9ACTN|nr:hypothetical protein SSP24_79060 [Streptomyces spinoverrucosus]GHB97891.1 hypothetical protein GCM10010397_83040 [Streptomyces spinoverrucosus]